MEDINDDIHDNQRSVNDMSTSTSNDDDVETTSPNFDYVYHGGQINEEEKEFITTVRIDDTVTTIDDEAFQSCYNLKYIEIHSQVTSIGYSAFRSCPNLSIISFADSVPSPSSLKSIGDDVFRDCSSLTAITIPDSVTSIGRRAFYSCTNLIEIILPTTTCGELRHIKERTFYECLKLTNTTVPNSIVIIDDFAFDTCTSLVSLHIPDTVREIGNFAFYLCHSLRCINIIENTKGTGTCAAPSKNNNKNNTKNENKIKLPSRLTKLGNHAFDSCTSITFVEFSENNNNNKDTNNTFLEIGDYLFTGCNSLQHIELPFMIQEITDYMFYECSSLQEINFLSASPSSFLSSYPVRRIGKNAFKGCTELKRIQPLPNSLEVIDDMAFFGCCKIGGRINFPPSMKRIGTGAFHDCRRITHVSFSSSNSIQDIEDESFRHCYALVSIGLPDEILSIGKRAFDGCTGLQNVNIPQWLEKVGEDAFTGCNKLDDSAKHMTDMLNYVCDINAGGKKFLRRSGDIKNGRIIDDNNNTFGNSNTLTNPILYPSSLWPLILNRVINEMDFPTHRIRFPPITSFFFGFDDRYWHQEEDDEELYGAYTSSSALRRANVLYHLMVHGVAMDTRLS